MDSPGVTEDDEETSAIREITEQCQRDMACGFIYVLDASRSAEEASQVCTPREFSIRKTIEYYLHTYGHKEHGR